MAKYAKTDGRDWLTEIHGNARINYQLESEEACEKWFEEHGREILYIDRDFFSRLQFKPLRYRKRKIRKGIMK